MSSNRNDFILWRRNFSVKIKNWLTLVKRKLFSIEFVIALLGIYFAYSSNELTTQSNTLSKAAYNLSKSDTSQQAQINSLRDVVNEIKIQNYKADTQTRQLIKITLALQIQDSISNNLLLKVNQQLQAQKKLQRVADAVSLNEIDEIKRNLSLESIFFRDHNDSNLSTKLFSDDQLTHVTIVQDLLRKGLKNSLIINSSQDYYCWSDQLSSTTAARDEILLSMSKNNQTKSQTKFALEMYQSFKNNLDSFFYNCWTNPLPK